MIAFAFEQEVAGFGHDAPGGYQRRVVMLQCLYCSLVMGISLIDERKPEAGVSDYRICHLARRVGRIYR